MGVIFKTCFNKYHWWSYCRNFTVKFSTKQKLFFFTALYWLVTTSGCEMNGKKLQEITRFIIHTLFLVQQSRDSPVPYSSAHCRKGLYSVLQACVLLPHSKVPSPVQCAVQLFSTGILDKSLEVYDFIIIIL